MVVTAGGHKVIQHGGGIEAYLAEFWSGMDEDLPSFGRVEACLARAGLTLETLGELGGADSILHALKSVA
jgi:hypothetical protein